MFFFVENLPYLGYLQKAHIVLNPKLKDIDEVSLSDFTAMMLDEETDSETSSINSAWVFEAQNLNYTWRR